jgi:hypothetical protein
MLKRKTTSRLERVTQTKKKCVKKFSSSGSDSGGGVGGGSSNTHSTFVNLIIVL